MAWVHHVARALVALLLDVLGGCGAIWGCAEAFGVRDASDNDTWRAISGTVGVLCFARWVGIFFLDWHPSAKVSALTAFLLQVLGGAGALWGCCEIAGFRRNYPSDCHETSKYGDIGNAWGPGYDSCANTYAEWRVATVVLLVWFLFRWSPPSAGDWCFPGEARRPVSSVAALFDSFVLEVMGAAGALWGCAEVAGPSGHSLRLGWSDEGFGQETFDFWRIPCAVIFVLFFARWVLLHLFADRGTPASEKSAASPDAEGAKPAKEVELPEVPAAQAVQEPRTLLQTLQAAVAGPDTDSAKSAKEQEPAALTAGNIV